MLLTEYLPEHDLYLVIPVINGNPDPEREFVFDNPEEQRFFIRAFFINEAAAVFAYWQQENARAQEVKYA